MTGFFSGWTGFSDENRSLMPVKTRKAPNR
jgi:hypothetical protein